VLEENYFDAPDGVPGNDDCGAMSSWAVLTMMGIYSVDPTSLAYELVSPVFPRIILHLQQPYPGKTFTIETSEHPETTPYIHQVRLNGRTHTHNWISFPDIVAGGRLEVTLGQTADPKWGASAQDAPPSLSDTP
jgi:putative alpha-1,2-mannosidase